MGSCRLGCDSRLLIPGEAVEQDGARAVDHAQRSTLPVGGRLVAAGLDQRHRFILIAAVGGKHRWGVDQRRGRSALRNGGRFGDQRGRRRELTRVQVYAGAIDLCDRKQAEIARPASYPHPAAGQFVPPLVIPQLRCEVAGKPQPSINVGGIVFSSAERFQRQPERRHTRLVISRQDSGHAAQEGVEGIDERDLGGRGRGKHGRRRFSHIVKVAQSACERCRGERFEIGLTG